MALGYEKIEDNARDYICGLIKEYGIHVQKDTSLPTTTIENKQKAKAAYITRKNIFEYLWNNGELKSSHHQILWEKYHVLPELERCIREFREIFSKKICHYSIFLLRNIKNLQ